MDVAGIRGPASVPPEKGPGGEKRARPITGAGGAVASDSVTISADSARQAASVESLAGRLKGADPARQATLAAVQERLAAGELDRPEVFRETAERILRGATPPAYGGTW